jgi:hypothetical protein
LGQSHIVEEVFVSERTVDQSEALEQDEADLVFFGVEEVFYSVYELLCAFLEEEDKSMVDFS